MTLTAWVLVLHRDAACVVSISCCRVRHSMGRKWESLSAAWSLLWLSAKHCNVLLACAGWLLTTPGSSCLHNSLNLERHNNGMCEVMCGCVHVQLNRSLPWRQPTNERRKAEQVRPIFWANRPKSYINRTSDWDKYPQGRCATSLA